jgi:hypothetical protein
VPEIFKQSATECRTSDTERRSTIDSLAHPTDRLTLSVGSISMVPTEETHSVCDRIVEFAGISSIVIASAMPRHLQIHHRIELRRCFRLVGRIFLTASSRLLAPQSLRPTLAELGSSVLALGTRQCRRPTQRRGRYQVRLQADGSIVERATHLIGILHRARSEPRCYHPRSRTRPPAKP